MLQTLGGLRWADPAFRREKPLLLLAYLALEGQQTRPRLARLFWPGAANPANSLAQHLVRLRPLCAVHEEGTWVRASAACDAALMRQHFRAGSWEAGLALYSGAFLDGLSLELNPDLDEWLLEMREDLAAQAQNALLTLAKQAALDFDHAAAANLAERCHTLAGATPLDDAAMSEVYGFLARDHHPHAEALRREARELGLTLRQPVPTASDTPPKFHLLLALTDHLPAIRAALKVSAAELTHLRLSREQAGQAAHAEALAWLEAHPLEAPLLHLEVARHLPVGQAWPHFDASRELWEETDAEAVAKAAHCFADAELKRGYPARAARVLEGVKQTEEVRLLLIETLLMNGALLQAEAVVSGLPPSRYSVIYKAHIAYRRSQFELAERLAKQIVLDGTPPTAHAFFVRANVAFRRNDFVLASEYYHRSMKIFALNKNIMYVLQIENLLATIGSYEGRDPDELFAQLLEKSSAHPIQLASILCNYAHCLMNYSENTGVSLKKADEMLERAMNLYRSLENNEGEAQILNTLGVSLHIRGELEIAWEYYHKAQILLNGSGNLLLLELIYSNLYEIEGDLVGFMSNIEFLREVGLKEISIELEKNYLGPLDKESKKLSSFA